MNKFARTQQWCTFARRWMLYDAKWQDVFYSADLVAGYLKGQFKPIYDPSTRVDMGDVVVVINTKEISMPVGEWKWRTYYHHTNYGKGAVTWASAWDLHHKDPTIVFYKAVYKSLRGGEHNPFRADQMAKLYLYPDDKVPEHIMENVCDQIRQLNPIPTILDKVDAKEHQDFPKLIDYPDDHVLN
ncbi:39S ribosomal protein L13, mitochondrial [Tetranychus urticae]|uniref:39S ribosomal protein L13, mitochondrial n=1 Tax=Tetranychus urticae TaxID=32264 RepID=UPI00035611FA|nr:39S ribosomal protein L13, mitochondrial [Tetranychus urticae]